MRLFVYGTLRRGGALHAGIAAHVLGAYPAETGGAIVRLPEGYPALLPGRGGRVVGEVLVLDTARALRIADEIEACPPGAPGRTGELGYRRVRRRVRRLDTGEQVAAWRYELAPEARGRAAARGRPIPGGDWIAANNGRTGDVER